MPGWVAELHNVAESTRENALSAFYFISNLWGEAAF